MWVQMRESDGANKENGEYKYGNGTKDVVAITTSAWQPVATYKSGSNKLVVVSSLHGTTSRKHRRVERPSPASTLLSSYSQVFLALFFFFSFRFRAIF